MKPNLTKLKRNMWEAAKHTQFYQKSMFLGRELIKLSKATPHHQMGTKILAQEFRTPCTQDFRYALLEKK